MSIRDTLRKLWIVLTNPNSVALVRMNGPVTADFMVACVTPLGEIRWVETTWHKAVMHQDTEPDTFVRLKCKLTWVYVGHRYGLYRGQLP